MRGVRGNDIAEEEKKRGRRRRGKGSRMKCWEREKSTGKES